MKTLKQLITLTLVLSTFSLFAQKKVALHSNGVSTFFMGPTPFADAFTNAVDGDTIYLPGGTFASPNNIDKQITIYGIGHNPDSSAVLGETIITGSFNLYVGAANSHFEGLKLTNGSFTFHGIADSVLIKRCRMNSISFNNYASTGTLIIENVIDGGIYGKASIRTIIANNIIKKYTHSIINEFANQAWIRNNIIVARGYTYNYNNYYMFNAMTDCVIDNNIIINEGNAMNHIFGTVSNNTVKNNVFNGTPGLAYNTFQNNYYNVHKDSIFVNYLGSAFNYTEDFNLQNPTTYVGTTGNEVGIYGGFTPAKFGMVPENPHYQLKNVATATDVNGDLQIQIQVAAQNE